MKTKPVSFGDPTVGGSRNTSALKQPPDSHALQKRHKAHSVLVDAKVTCKSAPIWLTTFVLSYPGTKLSGGQAGGWPRPELP